MSGMDTEIAQELKQEDTVQTSEMDVLPETIEQEEAAHAIEKDKHAQAIEPDDLSTSSSPLTQLNDDEMEDAKSVTAASDFNIEVWVDHRPLTNPSDSSPMVPEIPVVEIDEEVVAIRRKRVILLVLDYMKVKRELEGPFQLPDLKPEDRPYRVSTDEKVTALGLVRHHQIMRILDDQLHGRPSRKVCTYTYHYHASTHDRYGRMMNRNRYNIYSGAHTVMLDNVAPMSLADAIPLWSGLLNRLSGRQSVRKEYKKWTFSFWRYRRGGPPHIIIDARGSEESSRMIAVHKRLKGLVASAEHQIYIRSYGRIAECYLIWNPTWEENEAEEEMFNKLRDVLPAEKRKRQVYGPRVVDMSSENGKLLIFQILDDTKPVGPIETRGVPTFWASFCESLVEQPVFEVIMKPRPITAETNVKLVELKAREERRKQWNLADIEERSRITARVEADGNAMEKLEHSVLSAICT